MSNHKGIGGWDVTGVGDLQDVNLPASAGSSRDVDPGFKHDPKAKESAAVQLAYSMHATKCTKCADAQSESMLCPVGQAIYSEMRQRGVVS